MTFAALLSPLIEAARRAGDAILATDAATLPERKADRSPVTAADHAAEAILLAALAELAPAIPSIAEERAAREGLPRGPAPERFFLIDPLDGTKEFLARNGEFTVNVALIERGAPILGVIHLPASGETFAGAGERAFRRRGDREETIAARLLPAEGAVMMLSRSHAKREDIALTSFPEAIAATRIAGSSLKFCRLAEGAADLYPRFGPTMEWDTAAGQAILVAAGGSVTTSDGRPLCYGKAAASYLNPAFIARGRR